jgi:hypothetical protein
MLVQPKYGDRLDEVESLAKIKEGNKKLTEQFKIPGQSELEKAERAWGPQMPYQELIYKVQKLNRKIKVVDGSEGNVAIYVLKNGQEIAESENEPNDPTRYDWYKGFKYVSGCPKSTLPEYSTVLTDERGLAKRELRGWRSILLALVKAKAITYGQAIEEFGNPDTDSRSDRWLQQLQQYR